MVLREAAYEGVNWMEIAQDIIEYRAFVSTIMNFHVP
jgi:hypothetical protein